MTELLGVPTKQLTLVLSGVFAAGTLILAFLAARNRTSFRMAVRNVSRRPTQTALILLGLMLATLLFSAAFTTGNTLTNSLRTQALENIGRVDVVVKAEQPESGSVAFGPGAGGAPALETRERYFDESLVGKIRGHLSGVESVAGVAPLAKESVPVTSPKTDLSEPQVDVLGMDANSMRGFDRLRTASGTPLALGDLEKNEVYFGTETAEGLGIGVGDRVEVSLIQPPSTLEGQQPPSKPQSKQRLGTAQGRPRGQEDRMPPAGAQSGERPPGSTEDARPAGSEVETRPAGAKSKERSPEFAVAGVYESGANPASDTSMVMPLMQMRRLTGKGGKVNEILITHGGSATEGVEHTSKTVDKIRPAVSANSLETNPVKKDAIEAADQRGETFSTLFVLFGQFSVAAGMLLIFLIFVMLAAERKRELGMARAVGMQRSNLVRTFAFEGALYALAASAIGSVAGVGVGWVMVRLIGRGIAGEAGFQVSFATSPENVILAFCMGMVLTFIVVLISSWRVS